MTNIGKLIMEADWMNMDLLMSNMLVIQNFILIMLLKGKQLNMEELILETEASIIKKHG